MVGTTADKYTEPKVEILLNDIKSAVLARHVVMFACFAAMKEAQEAKKTTEYDLLASLAAHLFAGPLIPAYINDRLMKILDTLLELPASDLEPRFGLAVDEAAWQEAELVLMFWRHYSDTDVPSVRSVSRILKGAKPGLHRPEDLPPRLRANWEAERAELILETMDELRVFFKTRESKAEFIKATPGTDFDARFEKRLRELAIEMEISATASRLANVGPEAREFWYKKGSPIFIPTKSLLAEEPEPLRSIFTGIKQELALATERFGAEDVVFDTLKISGRGLMNLARIRELRQQLMKLIPQHYVVNPTLFDPNYPISDDPSVDPADIIYALYTHDFVKPPSKPEGSLHWLMEFFKQAAKGWALRKVWKATFVLGDLGETLERIRLGLEPCQKLPKQFDRLTMSNVSWFCGQRAGTDSNLLDRRFFSS